MRTLLALVFIWIAGLPVFSQAQFNVQELIDIYLSEKEAAIKAVETNGFLISRDAFRTLFPSDAEENYHYGFSNSMNGSIVGLTFSKNMEVSGVTYIDSAGVFSKTLDGLQHSGFSLVNDLKPVCEVYTKRKLKYFIWYQVLDSEKRDMAMLSVAIKNGRTKILYDPPKR